MHLSESDSFRFVVAKEIERDFLLVGDVCAVAAAGHRQSGWLWIRLRERVELVLLQGIGQWLGLSSVMLTWGKTLGIIGKFYGN